MHNTEDDVPELQGQVMFDRHASCSGPSDSTRRHLSEESIRFKGSHSEYSYMSRCSSTHF